jgi:hypothetical protein
MFKRAFERKLMRMTMMINGNDYDGNCHEYDKAVRLLPYQSPTKKKAGALHKARRISSTAKKKVVDYWILCQHPETDLQNRLKVLSQSLMCKKI